jgi:hypothetical protein
MSFLDDFDALMGGRTRHGSPAQLLTAWETTVAAVEQGYGWDVAELDNDLAPRRFLQELLDDPRLAGFAEVEVIAEQVEALDERYRAACRTGVVRGGPDRAWWERLVPRIVEGDLAEYLETPGVLTPVEGDV